MIKKIHIGNFCFDGKESEEIEIKEAKNTFPKEALKSYSAFANTNGGSIILGCKEMPNGGYSLVGVNNPKKVIDEMFNMLNDRKKVSRNILSEEHICIKEYEAGEIIEIQIPKAKFSEKPIYLNDNMKETYKRRGSGDYKCTDDEVTAMLRDASPLPHDSMIMPIHNFEVGLDIKTIKKYRNVFSSSKPDHPFNQLDDAEFLVKIGALQKEDEKKLVTFAGLLMFGKVEEITKHIPYFMLEYIRYENADIDRRWEDRILSDEMIEEGNLFNFFYLCITKITSNAENVFELEETGVQRMGTNGVNVALRESLVNCLMHADYKTKERIKITLSGKKYSFKNPGKLLISEEEFFKGGRSNCRNKTLAKMFRLIGLSEEAGSGGLTIRRTADTYNFSELKLCEKDNEVELKIDTFPVIDKIFEEHGGKVSAEDCEVLKSIQRRIFAKRTEIEEDTGCTRYKVLKSLKFLVEEGIVERAGNSSSVRYMISEKYCNTSEKVVMMLESSIRQIQDKER